MVCISVCMWRTGRVQREGCLKAQCTCQSLYGAQRAMLQHHGPQHGKTWGRWVQCSSTTSPFSSQMWGSSGGNGTVWEGAWVHGWNRKAVGGAFGGWERVGAESCLRGGFGEAVGGAGILQWRGKASPPVTSLWNPSAGARAQGGVATWPSAWADRQSPHWATVQLASPGPFPPQPTPSGPGLRESGSRPPVDRPEPYTTESHLRASADLETAAASTGERCPAEMGGWGEWGGGASTASQLLHPGLWMGAQRSLLLMITPTSPPGHSAFRACAGPHIPMATVAGPSTQCEWAASQVLPNWDEGETFWENAQSWIFSPLFCLWVIVFLAPVI